MSRDRLSPRDPPPRTPTVVGFSDAETEEILASLEELEGPCDTSRARVLVFQLSEALEGYMGVNKEVLRAALFAHYRQKKHRA